MNSALWTDRELSEYLLGGLPRHKREGLEQAYLGDATLLQRLELAEDELVDRFVAGRLSWWARFRFNRHYLPTPPHREKVMQARRLMEALVPAPAPQARRAHLVAAASYAALLVVLAGTGVWLAARYNQQSKVLQALRSASAGRDVPRNTPSETIVVPIPAFVLYSGTRRGVLEEEQRIRVPQGAESIQLRPIVSGDSSQSYVATMTRFDFGQVAGGEARRDGDLVTFTVPVRLLAEDTYILRLQSLESGFHETYQFAVRLRSTQK